MFAVCVPMHPNKFQCIRIDCTDVSVVHLRKIFNAMFTFKTLETPYKLSYGQANPVIWIHLFMHIYKHTSLESVK